MTSKYHNHPFTVDNIRFDSKAEAARYRELKLAEVAGEITALRVHPRYQLQKSFEYYGKLERAIYYEADFEYIEEPGILVVEDVKGMETAVFQIKRKLFLYLYPHIDFRVLKC
jgi:hypothetical protein